MADFEYNTIDFGQDNTDVDTFRSYIEVLPGQDNIARRRISFPGIDAEYVQDLGIRGRTTTWMIDMAAKAHATLVTFETSVKTHQQGVAAYALTERGASVGQAYIELFEPVTARIPLQSPWAYAQRYVLKFRVLPS
jgi:hypothetical protein